MQREGHCRGRAKQAIRRGYRGCLWRRSRGRKQNRTREEKESTMYARWNEQCRGGKESGGRLTSREKVKAERKTAGGAIAKALDRLGAAAQTIQQSKTTIAVERLQKDYESRLSINEMVKGFCVMENEIKAAVFAAPQPGEAHDHWLMSAINSL